MRPHNSSRGNDDNTGEGYHGRDGYDDGYADDGYGYNEANYAGYDDGQYDNAQYGGEYDDGQHEEAGQAQRRPRRRLLRRKKLIAVIAAVVVLGGGSLAVVGYIESLPLPDQLAVPETTTVYYADGKTVMATLGRERRTILPIDKVPEHVISAVLAAEDHDFWEGSRTNISSQYVRLAADIKDRSTFANLRVAAMAAKLEDKYSKKDILGFYLNTVYFGRGAHGIEEGAKAYFAKPAASLTIEEAMVVASVIRSPEDGAFDPTVNADQARQRWESVRDGLREIGKVDQATAAAMVMPTTVVKYDPKASFSGLDRPTGLVVRHVLSELRLSPVFHGKPAGYIENGGFSIITTINPQAQALLEKYADETVPGSVLNGEPENLQAAAVVVEPGTGRVMAFYGGHDGTGSDFAGWYYDDAGTPTGYGAHQPGATFQVYALAAALKSGISIKSYWNAKSPQTFPQSGRTDKNPIRNGSTAKCQPVCTLNDAIVGSLDTVAFAVTEVVGPREVLDMARAAGIDDMWSFTTDNQRERTNLRSQSSMDQLVPATFANEVGLGQYPVTVVDQANAMATFAAGGLRAEAHFVREVRQDDKGVYSEKLPTGTEARILTQAAIDDLTFTLSQVNAGKLSGRSSASKTGSWLLGRSTSDNAHAWLVGYTPTLAMAVWVGNKGEEKALKTKSGSRISGAGLPANIYRLFMNAAHNELKLKKVTFPPPKYVGDDTRGNTPAPG